MISHRIYISRIHKISHRYTPLPLHQSYHPFLIRNGVRASEMAKSWLSLKKTSHAPSRQKIPQEFDERPYEFRLSIF